MCHWVTEVTVQILWHTKASCDWTSPQRHCQVMERGCVSCLMLQTSARIKRFATIQCYQSWENKAQAVEWDSVQVEGKNREFTLENIFLFLEVLLLISEGLRIWIKSTWKGKKNADRQNVILQFLKSWKCDRKMVNVAVNLFTLEGKSVLLRLIAKTDFLNI